MGQDEQMNRLLVLSRRLFDCDMAKPIENGAIPIENATIAGIGFRNESERSQSLPEHLINAHRKPITEAEERMSAIVRSGFPYCTGTEGVHGSRGIVRELQCLIELGFWKGGEEL